MKTKGRLVILCVSVLLAVAVGGCSLELERNPDGSLRLETTMTEEGIQDEIRWAIADPLITNFTADLRDGYVYVTADRRRVYGDVVDTMSFRLDLGVSDGHMTAVISDVRVDGLAVDEARVAVWNQTIATRLERAGKRNPDSTLQAVSITDDAITMVWRIETARSRGD